MLEGVQAGMETVDELAAALSVDGDLIRAVCKDLEGEGMLQEISDDSYVLMD